MSRPLWNHEISKFNDRTTVAAVVSVLGHEIDDNEPGYYLGIARGGFFFFLSVYVFLEFHGGNIPTVTNISTPFEYFHPLSASPCLRQTVHIATLQH